MKRWFAASLGILAVAVGTSAPRAWGDDEDHRRLEKELDRLRAAKNREIDELRKRLATTEDRAIEDARRFDAEKRRLLDQAEAAEKRSHVLERDLRLQRARTESLEKEVSILRAKLPPEPPETPEAEVRRRLAEQKVTVNFDRTPLEDAVAFLRDISGLNFVHGAMGERTVTLKANDLTLARALDLLTAGTDDLAWEAEDGIVYLCSKRLPPPAAPGVELPKELAAKLAKKLTLNFDETPLEEVVAFLRDLGGDCFALSEKARKQPRKVSLRLRDVPVTTVLEVLARFHGLTYRVEGGKVVLDAR